MSPRKTPTPTRPTTQRKSAAPSAIVASTVYKDFTIYTGKTAPSWHPVKKMRYVFFRMIGGSTVTDAIAEIHWQTAEFWHLVDLKRHAPFREEYKRAKLLQGRAFADAVVTVAEGRDAITRKHKRRMERLIEKAMRRIRKSKKTPLKARLLLSELLDDLREHDKIIMSRNKLQIEAAKWIAKTSNPAEFSDASKLSLNGGDGDDADPSPIRVQFVGPDGQAVKP